MLRQIALTASMFALATAALSARQHEPHQPPAGQKPDHMQHAFDDPDKYAKQFDDPARDAWQLPDRVVAALGLKAGQSIADIDDSRVGSHHAQALASDARFADLGRKRCQRI